MSTQVQLDPKVIADQARDELLATDGWFAQLGGNGIISADPGDITTTINTALGQLGMVVVISPVAFRRTKPNLRLQGGPFFDLAKLSVLVAENPTLNRQGTEGVNYITAQSLVTLAAAALDNFAPAGINEKFIVTDLMSIPIPQLDAENQPALNIWHVDFTLGAGIGYNKGTVAPVTFQYDAVNQVVFVSCATPGASIWYCYLANPNQNNYPAPANPNAKLALMLNSGLLLNEDGTPMLNEDGSYQMNEAGAAYAAIPLSPGQYLAARGWRSGLTPQNAPNDQQIFQAPT